MALFPLRHLHTLGLVGWILNSVYLHHILNNNADSFEEVLLGRWIVNTGFLEAAPMNLKWNGLMDLEGQPASQEAEVQSATRTMEDELAIQTADDQVTPQKADDELAPPQTGEEEPASPPEEEQSLPWVVLDQYIPHMTEEQKAKAAELI
ncbi:hypothetical protein KI688_010550 [Linnemannia hyalina]|uniref:Uncharacterized protein n=1 Tax=Linnemannia hyalina TaxID=64524 RepID=A0A9P7XVN8_9FUNG|nr:hypothetical protein KI688_010550 [Linnemannia hyalina]